jgi:septal ring-binding cell division protein DamX
LTARKEPAVVNEVSVVPRKAIAREVPVAKDEDFKEPTIKEEPSVAPAISPAIAAGIGGATQPVPHFAQLLSTSDQKTAEALAAKLIDGGFTSAYVERGMTDKGTIFRVRVKFPSEQEARAAVTKLSQFSKDVWITK